MISREEELERKYDEKLQDHRPPTTVITLLVLSPEDWTCHVKPRTF
jgi:hypothetical protein